MDKQTYSSDEVQAILGRALERQQTRGQGELTYDELVAIGRDVGLSEAAIGAAAREQEREGAVDAELARRLSKGRRGFVSHAASYVLVNAFLLAMNLMSGGPLWAFWPLAGWGLALAFHLLSVVMPDRDKLREKARASLERRRRDDDKRREKAAKREQKELARAEAEARRQALGQNATRLKRVVEERLTEAVAELADRLETAAPGAPPPPAAGRSRVAEPRPKTRVEPGRDPWAEADDDVDDEAAARGRRGARY